MSEDNLPILSDQSRKKSSIFTKRQLPAKALQFERYQYSPLNEQQFRLLRVSMDPSTGHIMCSFHVRELASSLGTYRAISYSWGDPTPTYRVQCTNGQSLVVTRSCGEILTHVLPRHQEDFFWIDQLCINQKDNAERAAQVLLMGEIYSSTKQVIAWLGRGDPSSEKAIDYVGILHKEIEEMKRKGLQPTLEPMISSEPKLRNLPTELLRERKWSALSGFLRNPWFQRVWVMQEVIMACAKKPSTTEVDDHTVLSLANRTINFDILAEVLGVLERDHLILNLIYDRSNPDGTTDLGVDPPGTNAVQMFSAFRSTRSRKKPVLLNTALSRTWHFKATNPRDKMYAVLGFCDDVADPRLRPDYDASVEDIYQSWTTVLLERSDEYALPLPMAGIGLDRKITSLPSWVPDFSTSSCEVQLRPQTLGGGAGDIYQASGAGATTQITFDNATSAMRIQVIQIDTVEMIFPQPATDTQAGKWVSMMKPLLLTPEKAKYAAILKWLESIEAFLHSSLQGSENCGAKSQQLLSETLAGNYPHDGNEADTDLLGPFDCWYQSHRELAGKDRASSIATQTRKANFYDQVQAFEDLKATSLHTRPVFSTARKQSLGHGPMGLKPGDVVCIVKGALTPFLFRKVQSEGGDDHQENGGRWQLVGVCFVHGLMYGEGLKMGKMEEIIVV